MRGARVVILGLAFLLFATGATGAPLLYVADREPTAVNSRVAVVDLQDDTEKASIYVPTPYGISITPDGTKAYTANWQNWSCYAIDLTTPPATTTRMEKVMAYAQHIALTPNGDLGYVASVAGTGDILIINTATDTFSGSIPLGDEFAIVGISYTTVSPDGRWLFVVDGGYEGYLYRVDLTNGGIQQAGLGSYLTSAVVSQDGTGRLYISGRGNGGTYAYNADTLDWMGYVPGAYGLRMTLSKDGTRLYLTNYWNNCLQIVDTGTYSMIASVPINRPVGLALTSDEKTLLVSSETGGYVAVIDLASNSITKTLGGFVQPEEIAILAGPEVPEVPEVLQVAIDIKPGGHRNPINLKNKGKVWVAILSDATFNAATVNPSTVVFAGASPLLKRHKGLCVKLEDVNGDGLLDMVLHFKTEDLTLQPGETQACLTGQTFEPVKAFTGCDSVRTVKWEEQQKRRR